MYYGGYQIIQRGRTAGEGGNPVHPLNLKYVPECFSYFYYLFITKQCLLSCSKVKMKYIQLSLCTF